MFESKLNRGKSNGYAPLNNNSKIPNQYLNVVDSFYSQPSSNTIDWDISGNSINYQLTLTSSATTINLVNVRNGDYGCIILTQGSGGNKTITLGTLNGNSVTHKVVNNGGGIINLSPNTGDIDVVSFMYNGTNVYWNVGLNYT
jgi:hypothetical protein